MYHLIEHAPPPSDIAYAKRLMAAAGLLFAADFPETEPPYDAEVDFGRGIVTVKGGGLTAIYDFASLRQQPGA